MNRTSIAVALATIALLANASYGQSPGVLYTWEGTGDIQQWIRNFGSNTVTFSNSNAGELTITETGTAGSGVAISDGFNRRLESSTAEGGLDLTGLDFLEFDLGHNGAGPVDVEFFVQATPNFNFVSLAGDVAVAPGLNTYQLPLSGLTLAEQAYIRTVGINVRNHVAEGNLVWTIEEVRSTGDPLVVRELATHNIGSSDGGLEGAFGNFDLGAMVGSNGGQNQTGLSHNPNGSGSLRWTDLGEGPDPNQPLGPSGAAVAYGNGTEFLSDSFNERLADFSNYRLVTYRMAATDPNGGGGAVDVQSYYQTGASFIFQEAGTLSLPIDGSFYELTFPITNITDLKNVQYSGVNLAPHANDIVIDIDLVRYSVPEPSTASLLGLCIVLGWSSQSRRRHFR